MISILAMVLSSCVWAFAAQEPSSKTQNEWITVEGEEISLAIGEQNPPSLFELVRACERVAGPRFYLQPAEVDQLSQTRVSAMAPLQMPKARFFGFVQGILRSHDIGCAVISTEPTLVVRAVRMQGEGLAVMRNSARFIDAKEIENHTEDQAMLFSTFVPLVHVDPQALTHLLARYFTANALEGFGTQTTVDSANGIYIVGFGNTLKGIAMLLRRVDVPPSAADLGILHCEVWHIEGAELIAQVEELAAGSDASEALKLIRSKSDGTRRLARYQGPVSQEESIQVQSDWAGAEERLTANVQLAPKLIGGSLLHVAMNLDVKGGGTRGNLSARITGAVDLRPGAVQALLNGSPHATTIAFLSLR